MSLIIKSKAEKVLGICACGVQDCSLITRHACLSDSKYINRTMYMVKNDSNMNNSPDNTEIHVACDVKLIDNT